MSTNIFIILISFITLLATSLSHPISMAGILMVNSVLISFYLLQTTASWMFYLLILMFLGGVMVIIMYMTSLAANEKMFFSPKNLFPLFMIMLSFIPLSGHQKFFLSSNFMFVKSVYETTFIFLLMGSFIILLMGMISVIKLMGLEKGPLIKRL